MTNQRRMIILLLLIIGLIIPKGISSKTPPQSNPKGPRCFWNDQFKTGQHRKKRSQQYAKILPTGQKVPQKPSNKTEVLDPAPNGFRVMEVALTMWRMRPAKRQEPKNVVRIFDEENGPPLKNSRNLGMVPIRIMPDQVLVEGDKVRFSLLVAEPGYLYVIDREVFSDQSKSDPVLIFPRLSLDNSLSPQAPIEIPFGLNQFNEPRCFTLNSAVKGSIFQIEEELTFLITQDPLKISLEMGKTPFPLELFQELTSLDQTTERFELIGGEGVPYRKREFEAGRRENNKGRGLNEEDPLAQTIYRLVIPQGRTAIIRLPLKIQQS